ncbi:hypothetical protein CTP10_R60190 [Cupriavidus sp. P-10]|uniref:hypothetical protein n=1 Tax=Cupriavidus sp. P-10 TaxID=2027911 RepID=UPI000ED35007|nr:hypothetical protein CTP10_R60190 [Cupriavidus sp. P-10]
MAAPSDPLQRHAVFAALTGSRASLERAAVLGDGLGLALWRNRDDDTANAHPGHHTLSVYLDPAGAARARPSPAGRTAPWIERSGAGFGSTSHLSHRFRVAFGVTPGTWRAALSPSV